MAKSNPEPSPPTTHQRRRYPRHFAILALFAAASVGIPIVSTGPGPQAVVLAQHGDRDHCEKFYVRMLEAACIGGRYQVTWQNRCADCGGVCAEWTSDEGPC
jgi:hypothetical protein